MHPLTHKRVLRERQVENSLKSLANHRPKSDAWWRCIEIVQQDINFLVEAAIEEGIESGKQLRDLELAESDQMPKPNWPDNARCDEHSLD